MGLLAVLAVSSLAATVLAQSCPDASMIAHSGTPVGKEEVHNGGEYVSGDYWTRTHQVTIDLVNMYITKPHGGNTTKYDTAVLYLTDVFGIQLAENKLLVRTTRRQNSKFANHVSRLADSFARAG